MDNIAEALNKILEERKKSLGKVDRKIKELEEALEKINQFLNVKQKTEELNKNKKINLFVSQEGADNFDACLEKADDYKKRLELAKRAYEELRVRFEHDTVNLCIIGKQGHGKSLLLQSISGLVITWEAIFERALRPEQTDGTYCQHKGYFSCSILIILFLHRTLFARRLLIRFS